MPLVQRAAPHRLLQAGEVAAEARPAACRADQGADRRIPVIWLSNGGASVGVQQEHRAARVPVDGLAGPQTAYRLQAPDPGIAIGGHEAQRALVDRPVPRLGGPGLAGRRWHW